MTDQDPNDPSQISESDFELLLLQRIRSERNAAIVAHNDALLRLHVTSAERDDARADVAQLRAALEGIVEVEMQVRKSEGWNPDVVEDEPHWKAAREALATSAK